MNTITLHGKTFKTYLSFNEIDQATEKVANQLNTDLKDEDRPIFLGILNGSFMFTADLLKKIDLNCEVCFVKMSSYEGMSSTGKVKSLIGLNRDIANRTVIIVEDVVDSGRTIVQLVTDLKEKNPKQIKVCTLLFKPDVYKQDVPIDYVGFKIPNDFVVGYGLDFDDLGRQYKDIYVIDPSL